MDTELAKQQAPAHIRQALMRLWNGESYDPHQFLGLHIDPSGHQVIRIWRPGARQLFLEVHGETVEAQVVHESGLFEYSLNGPTTFQDYRVFQHNGLLAHDPYTLLPTFGEIDQYLFNRGVHYDLHRIMGGRLAVQQGIKGVRFTVWAPSARAVSLVSDFNHWDGRVNPMRSLGNCGVWELFVPGLEEGCKYKFEIRTPTGQLLLKSDPYALWHEVRPKTASMIYDVERYEWQDQDWMMKRSNREAQPLNIYEIHLGSWRRDHGQFLNYRTLAHQLAEYCTELGYTHIELMPIMEHPLDESWGYQVTGFLAPTSRHGTPEDFQYFVDHLHQHHIGVILDWVPGHFPGDDFSLAHFDGTALYEHADPRQKIHPHWSTHVFNFGRHEVSNFLIASALYWLETMHIDGLRVDAVASMLYLDYGREPGDWIPNIFGGKENLEAIEFLKHLNSVVHQRHQGILTIAEESTSFPRVSHPVEYDGLGFDLKWNMGWMNDTLRYFAKDSLYRHYHQNDLTFGLLYAFTEKFVLVFSHDEVVHGKRSLLAKMPGDYWQQFANLRLLLGYQMCQPGKKLLFMGSEIGQWNEWYCGAELDWSLLHYPIHDGLRTMVKELNHFYLANDSLWQHDFSYLGFEWVDLHDRTNCVISYLRKGEQKILLCVHNFTPQYHHDYVVPLGNVKYAREVFNSDEEKYGGSGKVNCNPQIIFGGLRIELAPLATMIFSVEFI